MSVHISASEQQTEAKLRSEQTEARLRSEIQQQNVIEPSTPQTPPGQYRQWPLRLPEVPGSKQSNMCYAKFSNM